MGLATDQSRRCDDVSVSKYVCARISSGRPIHDILEKTEMAEAGIKIYNRAVMNPQNPQQGHYPEDRLQDVDNPLKVMQPGEQVVCEIKRHPIGLLSIYATFAFVVGIAIVAIASASMFLPNFSSQKQAALALGAIIICAMVGLFTYVSSVVYKGNRWIVTSDSITQISQVSLFRKQTSQLSLANLEDVTVEQDGILQSMFGFGRLRAESAGERSKFAFDYCPNPSEYAKKIIGAHEAYIAEKPDEMRVTNRPLANTTSFNQSYGPPQQQQYNLGQAYGQQAPYNPVPQQPQPQQPFDPTQPYNQPQQPTNSQDGQQ